MQGFWKYFTRYKMPQDNAILYQRIASSLPRNLVLWCFVRVAAHGTMGIYGNTEPDTLNVIEAMKRWETSNEGDPPDANIQHAA